MGELQKSLVVDATMENLDTLIGFVEEQLNEEGCPMKVSSQIILCLEEVYVNVVNYAYGNNIGTCQLDSKITSLEDGKSHILTIMDSGAPFNPLEKEDPDITLSVEERGIGGLGVYMVKQMMDEVSYQYREGQNILTLVKKWQG